MDRNTLPSNCFCNLGIAFNEAQKRRKSLKQGLLVQPVPAYLANKDEILKTWEILAIAVRGYEYRAKSSVCLDCRKKFQLCRCPWTETIKNHLVKFMGGRNLEEELFPWGRRSAGREVTERRLDFHLAQKDIQTVATMLCILDPPEYRLKHRREQLQQHEDRHRDVVSAPKTYTTKEEKVEDKPPRKPVRMRTSKSDSENLAHSAPYGDTGRDVAMEAVETDVNPVNYRTMHRFFSESQMPTIVTPLNTTIEEEAAEGDSFAAGEEQAEEEEEHVEEEELPEEDCKLIDPANHDRNESIKAWYSQFLRGLGMVNKSLEVAKFLKSNPDEPAYRFEAVRSCGGCQKTVQDGKYCPDCPKSDRGRVCQLCRIPVRGILSICLACGHGGHVGHLRDWFSTRARCPSPACKCRCLEMMA